MCLEDLYSLVAPVETFTTKTCLVMYSEKAVLYFRPSYSGTEVQNQEPLREVETQCLFMDFGATEISFKSES